MARSASAGRSSRWVPLSLCVAFLAFSAAPASSGSRGPATLSGSSWMYDSREVIGNRRLTDIAIPGTHDSGTYGITATSAGANDGKGVSTVIAWINEVESHWYSRILDEFGVLDFVKGAASLITSWWAKTQHNNFPTQLADGIRYFDLRVQQSGSSYYCVHSLLGANLQDLLSGIQAFYRNPASSHEILLLDFQHTFDMNNESFAALLKNVLRDADGNSLMIPRGPVPCLNDLWATKQRVVVFFDDDATVAAHPELWYSSSSPTRPQIYSPWPNTHDSKVLFDFLSQPLADYLDTARKSGYFIVMQSLATEGFGNVASSIQAHVFYAFRYVPILGKILKRLGYDDVSPMNFFDFNFGGVVLADFLDNPAARQQAVQRANVIIIDDYAHFDYHKGGGGTGGYLDLISELNTGRNAASPSGPYHGVVKRQTANFTADYYQTYPVEIDFVNTGTAAWDPAVVSLGTAGPYDRTTHLYTPDGWTSQTRIRMQNTAPVQPGQVASFKFSVMPDDNYATSYQQFELVADKVYQNYPAQWFGNAYGNTALYIQVKPPHYGSKLKSQGGNTAMGTFDTTTLTATFTNTGNMPWFPDTVFLGAWSPQFHNFYADDGNWVSPYRIRMRNPKAVMPGQDAEFTFDATASLEAVADTYILQLVADRAAGLAPAQWFGDQGDVTWKMAVTHLTQPGVLTGQLVSRSPDCVIARGQTKAQQMVFRNTGKITWYPDLVYLEAEGPGNLFTNDGNWFDPAFIVMQNTAPVKPGEEATFAFGATPDAFFQSGSQSFRMYLTIPFVWASAVAGTGTNLVVTVRNPVPFTTPSVWVTEYGDHSITRLDNASGAVLGTYPTGIQPAGVAVDASGHVWATNMGSATVTRLDGLTGQVLGTFAVGYLPAGIAADGLGNVWVANQASGTVTKLNGSTGAVIGTYPTGGSPNSLAVDASGQVWITNGDLNDNLVTRLDGRTGAVTGTFPSGLSPFGLAVDASGHVWVANQGDNTVSKLDRATGARLATCPVGASPTGVAVDACDDVWVTNAADGTITRVRGSDGAVLGTYPVGSSPFGVAVDATGDVWVADSNGNAVTRLDGSDGSLKATYPVGQTPVSLGDMTGFALKYLVLGQTLVILNGSLDAGYAGYNYDETLSAAGGTAPYTWRLDSGALPPGLSFSGGRVFGTPAAAGTSRFTVRVTDSGGAYTTRSFDLTVNSADSAFTLGAMSLPAGSVGDYYISDTFKASGGTAPYSWQLVSGVLPGGLDINPNGTFSGIPTTEGVAVLRVRASERGGATADLDLVLEIGHGIDLAIDPVELPDGSRGAFYRSEPLTATGGLAPYSWRIADGALPEGLHLNPDGVISGTPTQAGDSRLFTVEVTDGLGATASQLLHLRVDVVSGPLWGP